MNDMERQKFENAFKDAFHEAEKTPSDSVWTNIALDLERTEAKKMQHKLVFYKLMAAASFAFALSVAGIGYYLVSRNEDMKTAFIQSIKSQQLAASTREQVTPEILHDNETATAEVTTPAESSTPQPLASVHSRASKTVAQHPATNDRKKHIPIMFQR